MTKRNSRDNKEELWSKRFDENSGYSDGSLSRSAKKKAERGIPPILTTTIIFLVLLIVVPVSAYIWWSNEPVPSQKEIAQTEEGMQVSKNSTSIQPQSSADLVLEEEKESESEEEPAEDAEEIEEVTEEETIEIEEHQTEEVITESESKSEPVYTEPETQIVEEPSEAAAEEQPAEKILDSDYSTYTVKAGDNLYRIALNHNMTTDELKQLNGIASNDVQVGAVLRVE